MPANIKDVFDNFPKDKKDKKTNQTPIINYEDVKHSGDYVPYDNHEEPFSHDIYSEYKPKPRNIPAKPIVTKYVANPYEESDAFEEQYVQFQRNMEKKVEEITCKEVDRHVSTCKDCQNKLSKDKIIYIKDKRAETSQEIMELLMFLATGVFIIMILDKLH